MRIVVVTAVVLIAGVGVACRSAKDYISRGEPVHQRIADIAARLLARNPKSHAGLRYRGYLAISDNKPEVAVSYFQRANETGPAQPDVSLGLIQAL